MVFMGNAGRRTKSLISAVAWIALFAPAGFAQSPAAPSQEANAPAFEVATIKPSNPEARKSGFFISDDSFESSNIPLTLWIQFAYDLSPGSMDQIIGAPQWVGTTKFDINAKEDAQLAAKINKLPREERLATQRQMVQALLAERFELKVHHETRDLRVLALTAAKGGSKLTEAKPDSHYESWAGLRSETGKVEGRGATIKMLVGNLSRKPETGARVVIDDTGLTGKYDFQLTWSPQSLAAEAGDDAGGLRCSLRCRNSWA
jgi:uncharacterized protein (TIGR03435 family)